MPWRISCRTPFSMAVFSLPLPALTDASTEAPPEGFVRQVFDEHADVFEQRMKDGSSRLPEMIRAVAGTFIEGSADVGAPAFANVLDLGCGTGRAGVEFRDIAGTIHGVDLSPKMMDQARDKGVYDDLFLDDFVAFMDSAKGAYDLVLAVDSFLYTGPLEVVFASVAGVLKGGGGFAFTVEALDEGDFALRDTCRHAHGEAYIRRLAAEGGFSVNVCVSIANMRFDVKGTLFWLDKSG